MGVVVKSVNPQDVVGDKPEYQMLTIRIPRKLDDKLRKEAFNKRISKNKIVLDLLVKKYKAIKSDK